MPTAAIKCYWSQLVAGGCILCGAPAEIAHAHNGSVRERMKEPKARGKKLARYDWLVLPLCPPHGREGQGPLALDANVEAWERRFGDQATWIDLLCHRFGIDLWALANEGRK